jgi:TRAP transporter TAXI family solute receptor
MKWAPIPLLALVLSAPLCDRAASQTVSTLEQNRQKVNENVLFLMGGQPGATFNQIANDISVVLGNGYNLRVLSVDGGAAVQNVEDVLYLRNIDMALTTQEALNYLKGTGELGPNLAQKLTYVAPLFPNPLQILARSGATSIKDLSGKKVSFNNKGSATAQFVPKIFKTLGIDVQEFYLTQGDALEKLRSGEIDATICSCPTPVPAFASVKPEWGLRFVSVPYEKSIQASYLPASIGNEDYPTLIAKEAKVDTIAATTVLISFNWPKGTVRYERTAKFVNAFYSKLSEFYKPPRNPLWKSVNLAATIPGWTRFPAAEEWLTNWRAIQAKGQEADFKQFMSEQTGKPSTAQAEQLFHEFQIWMSKRN